MTPFALINGVQIVTATLRVPAVGAWTLKAVLDGEITESGPAEIGLGDVTLYGTILAGASGRHELASHLYVIGGANRLAQGLPARHYHSDSGVRRDLVIGDAIREAGETVGAIAAPGVVGVDFVRASAPLARVLAMCGGSVWHVGYDGRLNVGPRQGGTAAGYRVLQYDPIARRASLDLESLTSLEVGQRIEPGVVREFQVRVSARGLVVVATVGGAP